MRRPAHLLRERHDRRFGMVSARGTMGSRGFALRRIHSKSAPRNRAFKENTSCQRARHAHPLSLPDVVIEPLSRSNCSTGPNIRLGLPSTCCLPADRQTQLVGRSPTLAVRPARADSLGAPEARDAVRTLRALAFSSGRLEQDREARGGSRRPASSGPKSSCATSDCPTSMDTGSPACSGRTTRSALHTTYRPQWLRAARGPPARSGLRRPVAKAPSPDALLALAANGDKKGGVGCQRREPSGSEDQRRMPQRRRPPGALSLIRARI